NAFFAACPLFFTEIRKKGFLRAVCSARQAGAPSCAESPGISRAKPGILPGDFREGSGRFLGIVLIRSIILYLAIILALRLMGKRQMGELQPTEFVITLLIAEVAAVPMQSNEIPMAY